MKKTLDAFLGLLMAFWPVVYTVVGLYLVIKFMEFVN